MKHFRRIASLSFLLLALLPPAGNAASLDNSLNPCAASLSSDLLLHIPILTFNDVSYWADFQYVPNTLDFELQNAGVVTDTSSFNGCAPSTLSPALELHIPVLTFNDVSYWGNLSYSHGLLLTLTGAGQTPFISPAVNYFPLDVGNKWIYTSFVRGKYRTDEIIGTEIINGITTYIEEGIEPDPDNYHEKLWLTYDSSSVLLYRMWNNEGADPAIDVTPPGAWLSLNPQVGDTWALTVSNLGTMNVEVLSVNDTVTVPAGTFTNCIKVQFTSSGDVSIKDYAPGVGLIRYEELAPDNWVEELVYADIASKAYGVAPQ
jgi:hypothetical protein